MVNGVVYVGGGDNVYAIQASTGKILWIYATGLNVESAPAVVNNVVYVSSDDYSVYALNATTGAKLWSYATGGFIQPDVTVANGVLYAGSNDDKIYAINTV